MKVQYDERGNPPYRTSTITSGGSISQMKHLRRLREVAEEEGMRRCFMRGRYEGDGVAIVFKSVDEILENISGHKDGPHSRWVGLQIGVHANDPSVGKSVTEKVNEIVEGSNEDPGTAGCGAGIFYGPAHPQGSFGSY